MSDLDIPRHPEDGPQAEGDPTRLQWSIDQGHSPEVIAFKANADIAIAVMQKLRSHSHSNGDKVRWCNAAITELEVATMWAIKALTSV